MSASPKTIIGEGLRFLLLGGLNTVLTLALYELLLFWLEYRLAYSIAWACGVVFISIAYPKLVYRQGRLTFLRAMLNAFYYGVSYLMGLALLWLFSAKWGIPDRASIFLVIGVITPINFLMSKLIFEGRVAAFVNRKLGYGRSV